MKKRLKRMRKKGAIEMSMTTIIIVVIGVTLLVLGIRFVVQTMSGISGQQEKIQEMTEGKLAEMFGESEKAISLPQGKVEIKQGDSDSVKVYMRNPTGGTETMKYKIDPPKGKETALNWLTWTDAGRKLASGGGYEDTLLIDVPGTAKLGNYIFTLELDCQVVKSEELCFEGESQEIATLIVTVRGG